MCTDTSGRFPPGPHCDFGGSLSVPSSWATSSIKKKNKQHFILTVLLVSMKLNVIQTGLRMYIFLILKEIRWFHGTLKVLWSRTWVSMLVHSYFSRSRNIETPTLSPGPGSRVTVAPGVRSLVESGCFIRIYCINYGKILCPCPAFSPPGPHGTETN